jgi:hypothetical protein
MTAFLEDRHDMYGPLARPTECAACISTVALLDYAHFALWPRYAYACTCISSGDSSHEN